MVGDSQGYFLWDLKTQKCQVLAHLLIGLMAKLTTRNADTFAFKALQFSEHSQLAHAGGKQTKLQGPLQYEVDPG